jgi:hypothetical protein
MNSDRTRAFTGFQEVIRSSWMLSLQP